MNCRPTKCRTQPTAPCSDCPWSRGSLSGLPGDIAPEEWLHIARGESSAECHVLKSQEGQPWACAGLAIFRANICKRPRDRGVLRLSADRNAVFSRNSEFLEHYSKLLNKRKRKP